MTFSFLSVTLHELWVFRYTGAMIVGQCSLKEDRLGCRSHENRGSNMRTLIGFAALFALRTFI